MKIVKKVVALIITAAIVVGVLSVSVSAESGTAATAKEEYVATVYVCQQARNAYLSGHTWLYFVNLTDHTITVGLYSLPKGQGVSIGTRGYSIADGRGLYYNTEAWRLNAANTTDFVSLKKNLTQSQLDKMSTRITKSGFWTYLTNCSFSAFNIWDVTPEKFIPYLLLPILARLCILIYPQHEGGFKMYSPKYDQVFKQVGWGSNAYLVPSDPRVTDD